MVQNLEMACVQSEVCSVSVGWKLLAILQRNFWNYQLTCLFRKLLKCGN